MIERKLQVFVSATYKDLVEERQSVVRAVLRTGHIPAGMELFVADNRSQLEVIYEWMSQSDMVVFLQGPRYGSIDQPTGLSYTHLEILHAEQLGLPILTFLLDDQYCNDIVADRNVSDERMLKEYINLRNSVSNPFLCSIVKDTSDLEVQVAAAVARYHSRNQEVGWCRIPLTHRLVAESQLASYDKDNQDLRDQIRKLGLGSQRKDEIEEALQYVSNKGYYEFYTKDKEFVRGKLYSLADWMLFIDKAMKIYPYRLTMRNHQLYQVIAPELVRIGLMRPYEEKVKFMNSEVTHTYYEFTEKGSGVLLRIKATRNI